MSTVRSRSARRAAPVLITAAALLLTACGSDDGGGSAAAAAGEPQSGGTLTFAVSSDAGCVDPQQVGSNDTIYSTRQLVDSLTDQDPDTGEIVPWLAESWEVSDDATTFTFHLRDGVTFSDGTPLTAQVVKDNFDAIPDLGPLASLGRGYLTGYTGTEVVDDLTARVSFGTPNVQFLQATSTHSLGLVSSASAALPPEQRCSEGIVGSGPFTLGDYVQNQSITLEKRPGYDWGSSLWEKDGEAYLDEVVFQVIPEAGVRTGSLQSGQVDAISSVGQADEAALQGAGIDLQARANPGVVFGVTFNNSLPQFADPAVRQAVSLAVDRQEIVDAVYPTGTLAATSVLSSTTPGYTDVSDTLTTDPDRAAELLDDAGWTEGGDGIREKDGVRLELEILWAPVIGTNQPALELLQQQLREIGVDVQLDQQPIAQTFSILQSGAYGGAWGNVTRADPDILRGNFSTQLANLYRLPASELDELLTGQAAETDQAERFDLVAQAQQLLVEEAYTVPVVELQTTLGVSPDVHDLQFDASSRLQLHNTWTS
ncbi:ABC transporter substrate-binding protein [Blastococcus sp. URHD0036]|uniref:ABC transporter substrate-binding protein n=1 Tax=Blastococcus sp. URHD0036 TaxID=1380356 RepID=UPI00049749D0|nr:ABC transporter substrate-binding protein [Blastococcus sp. URHD0036]